MKILPNGIAVLDPPDLASRWIEECGDLVHELTVRKEICPHIKPGDVVVDAGAYLGSHTKAYLEAVGSTGKVIAFEPNPIPWKCLKHNCPTAQLENYALGFGKEIRSVNLKHDNFGASWLSTRESASGIKVDVRSLDFFGLERLNFFKLDVEGMEEEVIEGARETLKRCRPILYVEIHRCALARQGSNPWKLTALIESLGYGIRFMLPHQHLALEEFNVFFFPT